MEVISTNIPPSHFFRQCTFINVPVTLLVVVILVLILLLLLAIITVAQM